ncbi:MAG: MCE family protein [Planctomycetales bacterium]|nr:MCE family protein [Planctomycetales bacterium]
MDERTIQFRVGVLVVATVIITVILIALLGDFPTGLQSSKIVYVRFKSAPGVTINTPVRKSGILVGRVVNVELQDDASVLVTTRLDEHEKILSNENCRIATGNFLGDSMLEFVPSPVAGLPQEPLADGALLQGVVSADALSAMGNALEQFDDLAFSLKGTLAAIQSAGADIGHVAQNLNVVVTNNQDQFNRILTKLETGLGQFDTAMTSVNQVVDDDLTQKIEEAVGQIPNLVTDARTLINALEQVARAAEENLDNLKGVTEPLEQQGEEMVTALTSSLKKVDVVLSELQTFSTAINNSEGTIGQLIHNPELYHRINQAAANIEQITFQLEPIIYDVRVATDKIARQPVRLLRGVVGRQQSGLK